ncbi:Crp/Fnr family transcriptional regulator [Variovorax sp. ZT4R33]|uniref:Crp/Fnr family transcriptional regulator n=1 Tax=Variovorax sp. ZT4R33 TaxID=3443743 RepID=UPI003F462001
MPHTTVRSSLALRGVALFDALPDDRLDRVAQACRWQSVDADQPLVLRAQDEGDVYFIVSGRVRITTYSASGRQVTFRDCGEGELFGELAAIDGGPRSADVVTLQPSVLASLAPADFRALLREEPLLAERVMLRLASLVRQLSERIIDLSTLEVPQRLQAELLRMAQAAGVADNRARLEPSPKHAALASQISTNREQVTRELNALARRGVLQKDGKAMVVADVQQLMHAVADARGDLSSS